MGKSIIRRIFQTIITLFIISIVTFIMIQLPPGDFAERSLDLERYHMTDIHDLELQIEILRKGYGLDQPMMVQYVSWITGILRGDLGYSVTFRRPVSEVIYERMVLTLVIAISALLFSWIIAFPVGFYSAVKQHSFGDYFTTGLSFLGLAVPGFMLALLFIYFGYTWFGVRVGGLFSYAYTHAPWSWGKFIDLLKHLWVPTVIVGAASAARLIRVLRNNLLDELRKRYVVTARTKGLSEARLLVKYPVRVSLIPFISTVGWLLPDIISNAAIVSLVLTLPDSGSVLINALLVQDVYLAGVIIMFMATLTVIGTLISDFLLAVVDPRIRAGYRKTKAYVSAEPTSQ